MEKQWKETVKSSNGKPTNTRRIPFTLLAPQFVSLLAFRFGEQWKLSQHQVLTRLGPRDKPCDFRGSRSSVLDCPFPHRCHAGNIRVLAPEAVGTLERDNAQDGDRFWHPRRRHSGRDSGFRGGETGLAGAPEPGLPVFILTSGASLSKQLG